MTDRDPITGLSPTELHAISREVGERVEAGAPDLIEIEVTVAEVMLTCASHVVASPGRFDGSLAEGLGGSVKRLDDALRQNKSRAAFGGGSSTALIFPSDARRILTAVEAVAKEASAAAPTPKGVILRHSISLRSAAVMENTRGGMVGIDATLVHLIHVCAKTVLADPRRYVVALDDGVVVTEGDIEIIKDCYSEIIGLGGDGVSGIRVSPMSAAAFSLAMRLVAEYGS